jgi:hypothetical protein
MDQETIKSMIADLEYRKAELIDQRGKTDDAIKALQDICEHKFIPNIPDSHHRYEKCKYCGKEQKG